LRSADRSHHILPRRWRIEATPAAGRLTLGLYNCYDPKTWQDIMRITLARVGPVALAFDCDVATFGFPFAQARERGAKVSAPLRAPADVAAFVAGSTSIGEGGEHFEALVTAGRFQAFPFPVGGFPSALGAAVATTPRPEGGKATTPFEVAQALEAGEARLLVFGLGPRGLPAEALADAPQHLEITGKGISMETATALGALPAMLAAHRQHLRAQVAQ